jgi:GH25 family lysozyme M1 (1,4-beta-N-acetylmuramidase)
MSKLKVITVIQSVLIVGLISILACILVFLRREDTAVPASLEMDSTEATTAETEIITTEVYYEVTGKKILLKDSVYGEIWLPVLADVPASAVNPEQLVTRNGMTYYKEENVITSHLGVDVSSYQHDIDWETVREAGVEFAFIRAGYRGYGSGALAEDANFYQNIEGALAAGIDVGVYFYSQALTVEEAVEEADMVLNMVSGYSLTYPIVYDWEIVYGDSARTDSISVETLTDCTVAFCERIAAAGYTPMVYQNKRTSLLKLDLPELTDYDFWLAEYGDEATYYYNYDIWQYTSEGQIPGIEGDVDINICFKDYKVQE